MPLDTTAFTVCSGCGAPLVMTDLGWTCPSCDKPEVVKLPKSADVRHRQNLMIKALEAGNRETARYWARCAAGYRQRDAQSEPHYRDDWVDRCGW